MYAVMIMPVRDHVIIIIIVIIFSGWLEGLKMMMELIT